MSQSSSSAPHPSRRRFSIGSARSAVVGLGAAAACSLVLSGCGGGSPANAAASASAAPTSTASPSATAPASSGAANTVSGADLGAKITAAIKKAGSGTVDMRTGSEKTEITFRYTATGVDQRVVRSKDGSTVEEVIGVGDTFYVKGVPTSKDGWVKVAPGDKGPAADKAQWLQSVNSPLDFAILARFGQLTKAPMDGHENSYQATVEACVLTNSCDSKKSTDYPATVMLSLDSEYRPLNMALISPATDAAIVFSDWGKPVTITAPTLEGAAAPQ